MTPLQLAEIEGALLDTLNSEDLATPADRAAAFAGLDELVAFARARCTPYNGVTLALLDQIRHDVFLHRFAFSDLEFRAVVSFRQFNDLRTEKHNNTAYGWYCSDPPDSMRHNAWVISAACAEASYVELRRGGTLLATLVLPCDPHAQPWNKP